MKCDRCETLIYDYVDNTLSPALRKEIDSHLEQCQDCRSARDEDVTLQRRLPEVLAPRLESVVLDEFTRARLLEQGVRKTIPLQFVIRAAACFAILLGAYISLVRKPAQSHDLTSYIETVSTVHGGIWESFGKKTTVVVQKQNGKESNMIITATLPKKLNVIKINQG